MKRFLSGLLAVSFLLSGCARTTQGDPQDETAGAPVRDLLLAQGDTVLGDGRSATVRLVLREGVFLTGDQVALGGGLGEENYQGVCEVQVLADGEALSSLALAFYTVYPVRLLAKYDAMLLIGWSILVLSFVMHFVHPSWDYAGNWNTSTVLAMVFIVIFGTTIPYLMFLNGVKYIGPTKSSLYASAEPLASTVVSVVWLKVHLEFIDYIGFVFIVAAVLLLSFVNPAPKEKENT